LRDITGAMDKAEAFLIDAMSSNGSTFLSFVYAIFFFIKRRWFSISEVGADVPGSIKDGDLT